MTKTFLKWFFALYALAVIVPSLFFFFQVLAQSGLVAAAFAALFGGMTLFAIVLLHPAFVVFVLGLILCLIIDG